ncbi:MAG: 30S ribosomal protein S17 [Candidatus Levybacteria bacterium]|nr:30S ribosomal protein S17 [Candidatus Levybacteria bacterium]
MKKILEGIVVSLKMSKTAVVKITIVKEHPMYKKLVKKHRKIKADTSDLKLSLGDKVRMEETRPISRDKHFKILEVIKK